jgi:hypothetical protein
VISTGALDDGTQPAQRLRAATHCSDVLGQSATVEDAHDLIELPLKHADMGCQMPVR